MRSITKNRFLKYILVGILNTLFGYSLFAILTLLGMDYRYSVLISTICGVLFNFKTIGTLVFKNKNNKLLFRFICVYVIIYLLNVEGLRIAKNFNINLLLAGAALTLPLAIVSYSLNKLFVFRDKPES